MKHVYEASSNLHFFISVLIRFAALVAIFFLSFYYHINPTLISIAIIICGLLFLFSGSNELFIYDDKVVDKDTSFFAMLFQRKGKVYKMQEIKKAYVTAPHQPTKNSIEEGLIAVSLQAILPMSDREKRKSFNEPKSIYVELEMKNGITNKLMPHLTAIEKQKAVNIINSLLK